MSVALPPGKTGDQILEHASLPPYLLGLLVGVDEPNTSTSAATCLPHTMHHSPNLRFGNQIPTVQLEPEDMEEASDLENSTDDGGNAKEDLELPYFSGLNPVHPNPMEIWTTSENTELRMPLKMLPPVSGLLSSRLLFSSLDGPIWPFSVWKRYSFINVSKLEKF